MGSPASLNFRMQFIREKGEALPAAQRRRAATPVVRGLPSRKSWWRRAPRCRPTRGSAGW